jgi:RimJ/RimL family protein N-acetyltransferase
MFGWFKKKDKDKAADNSVATAPGGDEEWGMPSRRKLSKQEAAKEAAEQQQIEQKNQERRDMYRHPGYERIFEDSDGRRLAIRVEENLSGTPNPLHPPLHIIVFWGTKELAHLKAEVANGVLTQTAAKVESGYENRGLVTEVLREAENFARQKGLREIRCAGHADNEWNTNVLTQAGYQPNADYLVKNI